MSPARTAPRDVRLVELLGATLRVGASVLEDVAALEQPATRLRSAAELRRAAEAAEAYVNDRRARSVVVTPGGRRPRPTPRAREVRR